VFAIQAGTKGAVAAVAIPQPLLLVSALGVVVGTLLGGRVLRRIPQTVFRPLIAVLLLALGLYMIVAAGNGS
jgi:uncharacterized membrane protein YfcA